MTRSKSKPCSRKKPERKTATFREHWNFFIVHQYLGKEEENGKM